MEKLLGIFVIFAMGIGAGILIGSILEHDDTIVDGYRIGQINALDYKWTYQKVIGDDGIVQYIKIKPTTRFAQ